jgi:ATP-binding protein involved in chromosome partitioning
MTAVSRTDVETALKGYVDPYLQQDLVTAKCIKRIKTDEGGIEIDVELGFPAAGYRDALIAALLNSLAALPSGADSGD